jgi:hypothetical protein
MKAYDNMDKIRDLLGAKGRYEYLKGGPNITLYNRWRRIYGIDPHLRVEYISDDKLLVEIIEESS